MRRGIQILASLAILALAGVAAGLAANNLSWAVQPAAGFRANLDRSLATSIDWVSSQPREDNAYLIYMVHESAAMSADPKLTSLLSRSAPIYSGSYLNRFLDPNAPWTPPPPGLAELAPYERWVAHAISHGAYPLSPEEASAMYEPEAARTGKATHQLFSLLLHRQYNGATPQLDRVIRRLSERIAQEAALDFRVTDLYLQRITFLFAAGQADLVKPRWVERALEAQDYSGGWFYGWYGWGPGPFSVLLEDAPNPHATAQGLWLCHLVKYRNPEWVRKHYP